MDIYWLGYSGFRIKGKTVTLVVDPPGSDLGYTAGKMEAEVVLVTHQHPGHNNVAAVGGEFRTISAPGEYESAGVFITGVGSFHDDKNGEAYGRNTMFHIEMEGLSLCHVGDLGHVPTSKMIADLGKVDVLMLPVGGGKTVDATAAAEIMRRIGPRMVVPMHYKTPNLNKDLQTVDRFLKEVGVKDLAPQPRLAVSSANLPQSLQVVLLDYPGSRREVAA